MPTTPTYALPYPATGDPANVPLDMQELAERVEIVLPGLFAVEAFRAVGAGGQPAFENGWVNFGSGFATAAFCKDAFGFVHVKGMVKSGTIGAAVFTLPVGYRPTETLRIVTVTNDTFGEIEVTAAGAFKAQLANAAWFSCHCSFRAA